MSDIISQHLDLSKEEINNLITEYQETKNLDIKDKIIRAHIKHVFSIVKKFCTFGQTHFEDYMMTGLSEVSDCIERIDLSKANLTTYSYRMIFWRVQQYHNWKFPLMKHAKTRNEEGEYYLIDCEILKTLTTNPDIKDKREDWKNKLTDIIGEKKAEIWMQKYWDKLTYKQVGENFNTTADCANNFVCTSQTKLRANISR